MRRTNMYLSDKQRERRVTRSETGTPSRLRIGEAGC